MERMKALNLYQKILLVLMVLLCLTFAVIYSKTISRVGFQYMGEILIPSSENDCTVYSGKIEGKTAHFTVSSDKQVEFQYGDQIYGPYTAKEVPSAIPKDEDLSEHMIGVELYNKETLIFRGGVLKIDSLGSLWLYNEDGSSENSIITIVSDIQYDENGNVIDPYEPSNSTILTLMGNPELTHKGEWTGWFAGIFLCLVNVIQIFFADELFRLGLIFRVQNVDIVEPSDWEIAGRYISWTVLPITAVVLFVIGLR